MTKTWDEVADSDGFKALKGDEQDVARQQYFDQVVAPKVPAEHRERAWGQFSSYAGVGRRALPDGVVPSKAGAGRGSINPMPASPAAVQQPSAAVETSVGGDPMGSGAAEIMAAATPRRESVLEHAPAEPAKTFTEANQRMQANTKLGQHLDDLQRGQDANRAAIRAQPTPDMTAGSLGRDVLAGSQKIVPTFAKGVTDIASMVTGGEVGHDASNAIQDYMNQIDKKIGSQRSKVQKTKFELDMADNNVSIADAILNNKGSLSDQVLPTLGSMVLPSGAAGGAMKLAQLGKVAQGLNEAQLLARAGKAAEAATIATTVFQNASDTFNTVLDKGGSLGDAYLAAGITAPFTAIAGKATGGGAEMALAKRLFNGRVAQAGGVAKQIAGAAGKEGAQESMEQVGQSTGEAIGTGAPLDPMKLGKEVAVAGTLGAAVGGGAHVAGMHGEVQQPKGFLATDPAQREERIKTLRTNGETAAADLLQKQHDKSTADASVETELANLPGNEFFGQQYRELRSTGVKPVEAAARSAVATTFGGLAQATGVPEKAMAAGLEKAKTLPLDQVPGFLQRFVDGLTKRGLMDAHPEHAAIGQSLEGARDDAMHAAMGAMNTPVKPVMDEVEQLEQGNAGQETAPAVPEPEPTSPAQSLDFAAHDAATSPLNTLPEPTDAQKEAGNYKVGRVNLHGINISIENPEGSVRRGTSPDGSKWENELAAHYGYIRGTEGNDGDHVDTFIGPNPDSQKVFVVDQVNKDGSFDEHKVMLGADSLEQADDLYHANYHEGWTGRGAITEMPMAEFKKWVKDGTKTKPVGQITAPDAGAAPNGQAPEPDTTASSGTAQAIAPLFLGRNNTPLTEGGKAFKTKAAADDARKLNPGMRVVRAEGGYALTEKTPAQLAAQEKAAKRLRSPQTSTRGEPIPAHAMIAAAGGLSADTRADIGIDGNPQIGNRKLFAGQGRGLTIERATERLIEDGYLPEGASHDQARALIKRSLTQPQYTAEGTERQAAAELEARRQAAEEAQAEEFILESVESMRDNQFNNIYDAYIPEFDAPSNTSTEDAMRALGFDESEINHAIANESTGQAETGQLSIKNPEEQSGNGAEDSGQRKSPPREDPPSRSEARREITPEEPTQTPAPAGGSTSGFKSELRPDGTLAVKGDAAAIREALKDIPAKSLATMRGGILVGKTQVDKAQVLLRGETPKVTAREAAEAGQEQRGAEKKAAKQAARAGTNTAPEGLSVGIMPNSAEPVTVKDGVVYIGKYEALDFDSGNPITVKSGATDADIKKALADGGALSRKQRIFGGQATELTSPTKDDVLAQQDQATKAASDKEKADRAADKQAREEEDRKRIAKASEAAADSFELGGDAMANLTGQQDIFAENQAPAQVESTQAATKTVATKAEIQDAGEKIGGARKDKWKDRGLDLTDLDGMTESEGAELATKANVWKPDYEAMAEASEPVTAAMVKTVYDQLAAQPKKNTPEGRRDYVRTMQIVRKVYTEAKSPDDVKNGYLKVRDLVGLNTDMPTLKARAREALFSVYKGRTDPFVLSYNELAKAKKLVEQGFPGKVEPWTKRLSIRQFSGNGLTPRGIELTLSESAELGTPLTKEQVAAGFYHISTKDSKAVGYAPTKADAEATAKTIYERDLKSGPAEKPEPVRPNLDKLKRENLPNRLDRDANAEDFVKDFGFRGVEFGNWAAQDERQRIINMAYDGLMDLAEIMGLPPKALSLNGTMGMAFGARGGGKFAAHYEPGKLVINMTKINGGGSMAHEWAHALDHYFGELNQKDAYTTKARGASGWYDEQRYTGAPVTRMEKDAQGKWASVNKMRLDNLRPEMAKAFDDVMSALFSGQETKAQMVRSEELAIERYQALADREPDAAMKATYLNGIKSRQQALEELRKDPDDKTYPKGRSMYAGQAQALSGKSTTGYWLRPTEMFARAFESWVFDKVAAMGAKSDYLVHGVEEDRFAGGGYKGNPYPTGAERANINAAFDKLVATIQTKETDKGVAMFARSDESFRRTAPPRLFMPVSEVQAAVDKLSATWKDGPKIKVVALPEELPVDAPYDARGLIHNGTAYVVASNHSDEVGVARTLAHEAIGHYGLWKVLGTDGTKQFQRQVQLAIKSGNVPLNKIAQRVRKLYIDDAGKFNLSPEAEANEIAAFAVEDAIDADGNFKPGFGFFKQVWAKVADFLRSRGFTIKFTNAELQGMLVASMRGLEAGKVLDGGGQTLVAAAREGRPDLADPRTGVSSALLEFGQDPGLYRYQRSDSLSLEHIAEDKGDRIEVKDVDKASDNNKLWMLANTTPDDDAKAGVKSWILTLPNGKYATLTKKGQEVYINVSGVGENNGGSAVYDLAANYALNNGLVFVGDPNGVSASAMRRRLENMLSAAIKYGTTDHLKPHPDQYLGDEDLGIPPLDWTNGDTLGNIRSMVDVSIAATEHLNPKASNDIRFDPATQSFQDKEGVRLDPTAIGALFGDRGRTSGVGAAGVTTLQRHALYRSLAQSEGARRALLGSIHSRTSSGRPGLDRDVQETFYARGNSSGNSGVQTNPGLFGPSVWSTPDATRSDKLIYELQDGRVDLKRVQQAIEKSGQKIAEKWDARLAETLYPGRVAYRSQRFLEAEVKPLLSSMAVQGMKMDELADYLHARGAEERNKQVAKVNDQMPDGGAGTNSKGVLMTNQAARDYLASVTADRKRVLDVMAAKVDAITAGTRSLLVAEGLEKQSTIDAWTDTYKNYVPMFRDEAQSGAPHPQGSGFTVKGSASKRATGSTKEVTNILAHVLMQREAAITRAEKNRVALSLYGQALSHPNKDFWATIKPGMTNAQIGSELQAMGVDPMTAAAGMETVPTITSVDAVTGKKVDRPNPLYKSLPGAIPLKVNGEDRVLMLNTENERGQRLAESLKNLDGLTKLDLAGNIIGKSTRWLAAVNTQYNPAFGLANLTRDVMEGAINLGATELRGNSTRVLAGVPFAIQGIARSLSGAKGANAWGNLYKQFVADGGQTGYKENWRDANDRAKAVEKELNALGKSKLSPGRAAHVMLDLLDGFNTSLENAVRLSAYKVGLDNGMSRANAARLGRELTVDFNRKGRAGREVGPLYAFFNASVQGSERALRTLKGPTGKKIIAGGLALGVIQAMMLTAAGYDDDDIPEFVKTRAFIIPLPTEDGKKHYIAIPLPLGFLMIPNTSRVATELLLNGGKEVGKRATNAIGTIAGSFNPLGGGNIFTADGALKTLAPTLVDPFIELGFNKNFAGNSIERQSYGGETDNRPGIARTKEGTMRSATGQVYMGISKALNELSGGTDFEAGGVSPTPERIRYLAQTIGGGVLREFEKGVNAGVTSSQGGTVKPSQIPVAGRFYGEVDDNQVQASRYYEAARRIKTLDSSFKAIAKSGDGESLQKFMQEHPEVALARAADAIQSKISKLNKLAVQTVGDREAMEQIDAARVANMKALNEIIRQIEGQRPQSAIASRLKSALHPEATH